MSKVREAGRKISVLPNIVLSSLHQFSARDRLPLGYLFQHISTSLIYKGNILTNRS